MLTTPANAAQQILSDLVRARTAQTLVWFSKNAVVAVLDGAARFAAAHLRVLY